MYLDSPCECGLNVFTYIRIIYIRDETILQYIDILQYLLQQYNTIWLKGNINILYIAIYCNVCLNVVNAQSLHHKNAWTSRNLDYTLEVFTLLYSYTGYIYFSLLPKPIFPYEISFYQNPIKHCNMAIYCNTLKHNTQYGIDPYCFTPSTYIHTYVHGMLLHRNSVCIQLLY